MSDPNWLVTGASGFLGANLGAYLEGKAHRIAAVRSTSDAPLFDETVSIELTDPASLEAVIRDRRPDVIVHSAALAHHAQCEADPTLARIVNTGATAALARAANEVGSRFIFISTDAVFDGERGHYTETDSPNPTSVYGRTKVAAEEAVASSGDSMIVRTNFFGWSPSGSRSILEFFVNELGRGEQVRGFTDFTTSSAYAQVLAGALWELAVAEASGIFHVTSPDSMTKYEFGVAVAETFDLDSGLITPTRADIDPPRNGDISLDVTKVQAQLGRPLPDMRAGLRQALADASTLRQTLLAGPGL